MSRVINWRRLAEEVVQKQVALILSVHHTGTWFAIEFLRQHPEAGEFSEMNQTNGGPLAERSIVHAHIAGPEFVAGDYRALGRLDGAQAIPTFPAYEILIETGRVVMPIRDPFLSILSRHARHPMLDHSFLIDAFVRVAEKHDDVTFLPVDCPPKGRYQFCADALRRVGLPVDEAYLKLWTETWKPFNVSAETAEKQWYRDGAFDSLLPVLREEILALLTARAVLRPFLESLGYEGLPWWTW